MNPNPLSLGIFGQLAAVRDKQDARARRVAQEAAASRSRSLDDAIKEANAEHLKAQSYAAMHPQAGLRYVQDADGNWVGLPTKVGSDGPTSAAPPSYSLPTSLKSLDGGSQSGPSAESESPTLDSRVSGPTPTARPQTIEQRIATPAQTSVTARATGVKGAPKAPPRIDPNSIAGISADSTKAANRARINPKADPNSAAAITADSVKAENRAAATERHAAPIAVATPAGVNTLVRRPDAVGKQATVSGASAGGLVRGLGPGGVFGAGSGIGSVNEMKAANPDLKTFEAGFLTNAPPSALGALDRFRQRLAGDLQTHGVITAATATEAERELAASNPDLIVYGRNLKQWIVSDMNLSRGGTDERARTDAAVSGLSVPLSSMPPAQRATYIHQMWNARDARLEGLQRSAAAAGSILDRVVGGTKTPSQTGDPDADAILAKYPKKPPADE